VERWRDWTWILLAGICAPGCLQTIDLRGPIGSQGDEQLGDTDTTCTDGERRNPETGGCEPCIIDEPDPTLACPCSFTFQPAPFPYCDLPTASYQCDSPCTGDISACNGYDPSDGSIRDCIQFWHCCQLLAANPEAQPCCPTGTKVFCEPTPGLHWPNSFQCRPYDCCETGCFSDIDCDSTFQTCRGGNCVPGCRPTSEQCVVDGTVCACQPI